MVFQHDIDWIYSTLESDFVFIWIHLLIKASNNSIGWKRSDNPTKWNQNIQKQKIIKSLRETKVEMQYLKKYS